MKRAVMKAVGMPMRKKRKAMFGPGVGNGGGAQPNPAKVTQDTSTPMMAPGKGYMPKKGAKKRKGSMSLVKSPRANAAQTKRRKGTMGMVSSPKANMRLRTKKKTAKKGTSGTSFGDESIQGGKMERRGEGAKHFKRSKKG